MADASAVTLSGTSDFSQSRLESDSLGAVTLPADCLYGVHTWRAARNFPLSGRGLAQEPVFLDALLRVKEAAARTNRALGCLAPDQAQAIIDACRALLDGAHRDAFIVDLMEGAGGTSWNMNVNEVVANLGLIALGHRPGEHRHLHPNDHVNLCQSTNDVIPTAIQLAAWSHGDGLVAALNRLADALGARAADFADALRLGRTCLQDAQPMTLGQAFGGYASLVRRLARQLDALLPGLGAVPLGGTAIGVGFGAVPGYRERALAELSALTGRSLRAPDDPFDAMQNADALSRLSGELRTAGLALAKLAGDVSLLASGPVGGFGEVTLPPLQSGSSIMPGKVNPVMPMTLAQVGFAVAGNDACVAMAAQQGQLEINAFGPVIASRLFESFALLTRGVALFTDQCVNGMTANRQRCLDHLLASDAVATALLPRVGYARAAELVKGARHAGQPLLDALEQAGVLTRDEALALIREAAMAPNGAMNGAAISAPNGVAVSVPHV